MTLLQELIVYICTKDRLEFMKFRQKIIKLHGYDKFKELLIKANKELENEIQL
jgi:hypothetical protein